MSLNLEQIEAALRHAPAPTPPPSLKAGLENAARLQVSANTGPNARQAHPGRPSSGWRRWWPVFLPAAATAAFATTLAFQQLEKRELEREIQQLEERIAAATPAPEPAAPTTTTLSLPDTAAEISRLESLVAVLAEETAAGDALSLENNRLRDAIAALQKTIPAEFVDQEKMAERAKRIQCVNNMKQLGLAVRVYATDNADQFPPDILSISNEISATRILICPSDEIRQPAANWATFGPANCSYEFLAPGPGEFERDPLRIMWRCPIHDNVTLCDGSVQQLDLARNPGLLQTRDGVLQLNPAPLAPDATLNPAGAEADAGEDTRTRLEVNIVNGQRQIIGAEVTFEPGTGDPLEAARTATELEQRYGLTPGSVTVILTNAPAEAPSQP